MTTIKLLNYMVYIFSSINAVYPETKWVDPFSMNVGIQQKSEECICEQLTSHVLVHYKRTINLLLASVAVDRSDPLYYKGRLSVKIPIDSYDLLKSFTKSSSEDMEILQRINTILNNVFIKQTLEELSDMLTTLTDRIYFTFYNRSTGVLLAILFMFFISYKLLRANFTIWSVMKYLIFIAWLVDFSFIWLRLLQDLDINKIADSLRYENVPPHCDPKQMSYFQYFWSSISGEDECRKYHKTMLSDTFWQVSPFVVFSHQFGEMVVTPATFVGRGVAGFTSGIIGGLPFPLNILLLPVLFIFTVILICVTLSFITETSFSFNLFHLVQFKFGNDDRKALGEYISGQTLHKILNVIAHRPMIENVREQTSDKRKPLKVDKENILNYLNVKEDDVTKRNKTKNDANEKLHNEESTSKGNCILKKMKKQDQLISTFAADAEQSTSDECRRTTIPCMEHRCSGCSGIACSHKTLRSPLIRSTSSEGCDNECSNSSFTSSISQSFNCDSEDISNLLSYNTNCSDID